ncbi:MAG: hypothetical protein ACPGED_03800 [Flavobacteriales bacterium]
MNILIFSLAIFLVLCSTILLIVASYAKQKGARKIMIIVSLVLMVFPVLYLIFGVFDQLFNG